MRAPQPPYLALNFAPVAEETTSFDLPVVGHIPEALTGRFLRIGPNPAIAPQPSNYHWFVGTGMAHGVRLRQGRAEWYRSRFIIDSRVAAALHREPIAGPGAARRDGPVNTNFFFAGGKLFAIVEAGSLPVELNDELESLCRSDFDGTLEAGFTAHPKYDPVTAESHVLAYEPGQPLRYLTVDRTGRARTMARIELPHIPLVHDVGFTESSIVVLDLPATFQPDAATTPFPWIWNERQPARVGLLPRNGDVDRLQWFEAPRCFVFHIVNAFDNGEHAVVDVVRHPRMFDRDRNGPNEGVPILARWTLDRACGLLSETILDDRGCEFPRINNAIGGRDYRFGYTAHWGADVSFGPAYKHDVQRGTTDVHDYGTGRVTLEPVFVRRPDATAEDDGWILSYVYDANRDAGDVVILDALDFSGDPVATIRLPARVPFGFHGGWAPDPGNRS